jgi:hypothetical protein
VIVGATAISQVAVRRQESPNKARAVPVSCPHNQVALNFGEVEPRGTLQLAVPGDTASFTQQVYAVTGLRCLPRAKLDALASSNGQSAQVAVTILVGLDPNGKPESFRDRLGFDNAVFTGRGHLPPAPRDMRFGEVRWRIAANAQAANVIWYDDYEAWRRRIHSDASRASGIIL